MAKTNLYDMSGKVIGEIELMDSVFGIEPNTVVMHEAVKAHLTNKRQGTQSRGQRRRPQAVAPEGHRPCSPGLHPRSSVDTRWYRFGSQAERF